MEGLDYSSWVKARRLQQEWRCAEWGLGDHFAWRELSKALGLRLMDVDEIVVLLPHAQAKSPLQRPNPAK